MGGRGRPTGGLGDGERGDVGLGERGRGVLESRVSNELKVKMDFLWLHH